LFSSDHSTVAERGLRLRPWIPLRFCFGIWLHGRKSSLGEKLFSRPRLAPVKHKLLDMILIYIQIFICLQFPAR